MEEEINGNVDIVEGKTKKPRTHKPNAVAKQIRLVAQKLNRHLDLADDLGLECEISIGEDHRIVIDKLHLAIDL